MSISVESPWSHLPDEAVEFLKAIGRTDISAVRVRGIHWDPDRNQDKSRKDDLVIPALDEWQSKGFSIYVVVNQGGDTDDSITEAVAVFIEWDDRPLTEQLAFDWASFGFPAPPVQVYSGGKSLHCYWPLSEPCTDLKRWRQLQARLIRVFRSDDKIKNPSRVMRLPGYRYFSKKDGASGNIAQLKRCDRQTFSLEELESALTGIEQQMGFNQQKAAPQPTRPVVRTNVVEFPHQRLRLEQLLSREHKQQLADGVGEGGRNAAAFGITVDAIACAEELNRRGIPYDGTPGQVLEDFNRRCSPPLGEVEVGTILQSAQQQPRQVHPNFEGQLRYLTGQKQPGHQVIQQSDSAAEHPGDAQADGDDLTLEERALWAQLQELANQEDIAKRRYRLAKLAQAHGVSINLLMQLMESVIDPEGAQEEGRRIFEVMDDDELFSPCDDDPLLLHYVIPGLVPVGEAVLLAGEAKAGKSLLMYEAIDAVLKGGEFLGEPCRRGKVLLLQLEENNSLKMRLAAKGITTPENRGRFRVIRNYDATNPKALDQLRKELASFKPDLVCLDSVRGAMTYSEENENLQGFTRPIKRVIKACQNANAGLIAIHHTNKNREATGLDRIAGNKALVGEFWGVLMLERQSEREDDPDRALSVTPRDGARLRMHIRHVIPAGEPFRWEHLGNIAGDLTSSELRHKLLTLLQANGELRTGAICQQFTDEKEETIRRALYRLRDTGLASARKGPADGSGRPPTLWSINLEHFERGMTVTTPDGTRNVFSSTVTPPLPPHFSKPSVSQNPPEGGDLLRHVTKPAQNLEAPEALPEEEEKGFVTKEVLDSRRGGGGSSDDDQLILLDDPTANRIVIQAFKAHGERLSDFEMLQHLAVEGVQLTPGELMSLRDRWETEEGAA